MKNIVCPISSERMPEHIARTTAFFVVAMLIAYLISGNYLFVAILAADFCLRSFFSGKYSPLAFVAKKLSTALNLQSKLVDKAPKIFAARLGFIFSLSVLLLNFLELNSLGLIVVILFSSCAFLEFAFSFCVGCIVYSFGNQLYSKFAATTTSL